MAQKEYIWEELGRNVQQIVDRAVKEKDFQKLNQTITQTIGKAIDLGENAFRRAMDAAGSKENQASRRKPAATPMPPMPPAPRYGKTGGKTTAGILKILGGSGLLLLGAAGVLIGAVLDAVFVAAPILAASVIAISGGGLLLGSGVGTLRYVNRFQRYRMILGGKSHCTLEKLAQGVGRSTKATLRDVQRMIREGLFLQGHLDREQTCLITTHETYALFEDSRLQLEQRQKERQENRKTSSDSRVREVLEKGNAFLEEIRRCNDAIPGQEISRKIYRMEMIVERIFERAAAHPEIIPDLKKMMDYYLPMTVKLLDAYADMDIQPVQGQNIQTAKREIEETLDTLNLAFEKLLDSVFADTVLDISSDISVLNTLLAQEGLTESEFENNRKQ